MTTIFGGEAILIGPGGVPEFVYLQVEDDDLNMETGEAGTVWRVNGEELSAPPDLFFANADITLLDGTIFTAGGVSFTSGGETYFFGMAFPPQSITAIANVVNNSSVGSTFYSSRDLYVDEGREFIGSALSVTFDNGGNVVSSEVDTINVFDDDTRIQISGNEARNAPFAWMGDSSQVEMFNISDAGFGNSDMVLVEVEALDGSGNTITFEALKYTVFAFVNGASGSRVFYIPRAGSVDLSDIATFVGETVLPDSVDGETYADFGLGGDFVVRTGGGTGDFFAGEVFHDQLEGRGGDDSMTGGAGEDLLIGGLGQDLLFGGFHNDTVEGGLGNDTMSGDAGRDLIEAGVGNDSAYGGFGNDRMLGDAGNDTLRGDADRDRLFGGDDDDRLYGGDGRDVLQGEDGDDDLYGNADNDRLSGGAGNDRLFGADGNDDLDGGDGADRYNGGAGADTFVLLADGAADIVSGFDDGDDLFDMGVAFGTLVITDIGAGRVEIDNAGDITLVVGGPGFSAASLTADDFL